MKFMSQKLGQTGLLISLCVMVSACNPDEYFPTEEFIDGIDAYCAEAQDENACSQLTYCQPAYNEAPEGTESMVFVACVANPDYMPEGWTTSGGVTGGTTGGTTGSTTGSTTGGTDGSSTGGTTGDTTGGTTSGTDGSTVGGTTGGTTGGTDGSSTGGSTGPTAGGSTGGSSSENPPTIKEAIQAKCANLDDRYLYVKTIVKKKQVSKQVKVKVCHEPASGVPHTIIIACPGLNGHKHHDKDYLGSCEQ